MIYDVWTDGSCLGNPGPAGWGYAIVNNDDNVVVTSDCGPCVDRTDRIIRTTNQHAELTACAEAFEKVTTDCLLYSGTKVRLHSDSAYLLNCLKDKWYVNWMLRMDGKGNWYTSKGELVANQWIWKRILYHYDLMIRAGINVELVKVKGHTGVEMNEYVDRLAKDGAELAKRKIGTIVQNPTKFRG